MAFDYTKTDVYFRGSLKSFAEANLHIASSPMLYGLSVYTVCSANWNDKQQKLYLFRLKDHYQRLINSCRIMYFPDFAKHYSYEDFEKVITKLLKHNDIKEDVLIRCTIFIDELMAGTKTHGLKASLAVFAYPMGEVMKHSGVHTCVSSWTRASDNAIPARAKVNGNYVNATLMKNEAVLNGYDEAIALDEHNHVAEGTVANIFMIRDGKLITPDLSTDILEGITRDTILKLASELNIASEERGIDRTELYIADELFFCGSSANITPILSVDHRGIGQGKIGSISEKLGELYKKIQHNEVGNSYNWLDEVQ